MKILLRLALAAIAVAVVGQLVGRRNCRGLSEGIRRQCVAWRERVSARCVQWEQQQRQECRDWQRRQEQRCDRWETVTERRCDRWEQEQRRQCDSWGIFSFVCVAWVWITTTVCRAWSWVTTTVCRAWSWVTTTFCNLWVTVTTAVCRLWAFVVTTVCTAWVTIVEIFCPWLCFIRRLLAPNEVSAPRTECVFGWMARYRITDNNDCVINLVLRIRLNPDADVSAADLANVRATWEQAIEDRWSGAFDIERTGGDCPCRRYTVNMDVQWVTSGEHHTVRIRSGSGRADMTNWFITSTGGTAAHEAGHMLGHPDEYAEPDRCPNRTVTSDNSIMQTTAGQVRRRHYEPFATWISNRTCCQYQVAAE
jgi:hypothetical protein